MTTLLNWPAATPGDAPLALPTDRVDCWAVSLTAPPADVEQSARALLSADELGRAERFHFELHRARYVRRHAALRLLLASYLGAAPASLAFVQETHGRPILAEPADALFFNLSDSGDVALVAVTCLAPVGVDVEEVRELPDLLDIARHHFARVEFEDLSRLPSEQRRSAFFVTWTRKEAVIKALGQGLSFPLDAFSTGSPDGLPSLSLRGTLCPDWTLADLKTSGGHVASLAIPRPDASISCRCVGWSWLLDRIRSPAAS